MLAANAHIPFQGPVQSANLSAQFVGIGGAGIRGVYAHFGLIGNGLYEALKLGNVYRNAFVKLTNDKG